MHFVLTQKRRNLLISGSDLWVAIIRGPDLLVHWPSNDEAESYDYIMRQGYDVFDFMTNISK